MGGSLLLWDAETGKEIRQLIGHTRNLSSIAFAPDGHRALSGGVDGTIRLWDVATGKELHCFEKFQGWFALPDGNISASTRSFRPDGRYAFSGGIDGIGRLCAYPTRQRRTSPDQWTRRSWKPLSACWMPRPQRSADGRTRLICSEKVLPFRTD